jgi:hypothetical protein
MGDSTRLESIPLSVQIAAVYRNGLYAARPADVAGRFPASRYVVVWIDVNGSAPESCQILDVERYDASPEQAPGWIRRRRALVHTSLPTVYCDRSTLTAVQLHCGAAGLKSGTDYQLWISTLDGTTTLDGTPSGRPLLSIPGVVAIQLHGGPSAPWDQSTVYNDRWHPLAVHQ